MQKLPVKFCQFKNSLFGLFFTSILYPYHKSSFKPQEFFLKSQTDSLDLIMAFIHYR